VNEARRASCSNCPLVYLVILAFTLSYLMLPMIEQSNVNYLLFGFIMFVFLLDGYTKVIDLCTKPLGVFLGGLVGLLLGAGWYYLMKAGGRSLVFFEELSGNDVKCSRPSKQRFVCNVYKNGELVKRL
jgi:hypothetical protein